jgi:hypothetical protein
MVLALGACADVLGFEDGYTLVEEATAGAAGAQAAGGQAGSQGGGGGGGNVGGQGGEGGSCTGCYTYFLTCSTATCPEESELCPGSITIFDDLKSCACSVVCAGTCTRLCDQAGPNAGCGACLIGACPNELALCQADG